MAMTPDDPTSDAKAEAGAARLLSATGALRGHTDGRWVEVAGDVLARAMTAARPSHPILARTLLGDYHVSEQVLTASLQRALDPIPRCEVSHIRIETAGERYTGATIVITAQYPHPLIEMADQIRDAAQRLLSDILGPVSPAVTVSAMHVHVSDVTTGDPKLG